MSDKDVILIAYSGHAYVVAETILDNGLNIIGYSDTEEAKTNPYNLTYLGFEKENDFVGWSKEISFVLGIGDNNLRQKVANLIYTKGKLIQTIIHKTAHVSKTAIIESGTFISKNVMVNALVKVGRNTILNTGCIIEHECVLQDAVHIAPGAVLAGNVCVGERSFIGANAVIKQGVIIGRDVVIGAGSVIIANIPDGKKVVGNPGRII
ncbi:N-acetylneuraminate synthase [Flavobacterium aquidurense]|uniref:acetyltransferase n=1 Tax=Flavobacterium aquidurense TaxID=362413 RepID=UPI000913623E|nr:acetyltransferase [Flavobacterium aquidurense]OXA71455.1 N-acetylneuraminate synthase [Flavobacterium aquidurense]SHG94681.1 sugar O-acyltransferase, sialic acid O-acetyltransferase NeuD family [Flavobacterium frigidimaris]